MHLSWLGQTAFKLQTKNADQDITIIIDPYKPTSGDFPRSISADLALFSHGAQNSTTLSQEPFILETLGELERSGVMMAGFPGPDSTVLFKVTTENISVLHLGAIQHTLDEETIEKIGTVDILLIPSGGSPQYLDIEAAAKLVNALEPRIVIPIAYHCDSDESAKPLDPFLKELGLKPEGTEKKLVIKAKDLPQEETKLWILEKNV
jgi:L-ascorbate metabolism protein UlaG (beta-lactamase superfamily)